VDGRIALAPGVALRGSYAVLSGVSSQADISMSAPAVAARDTGSGSGSEYALGIAVSAAPLLTVFADYRSATLQPTWSGGGTTTTSTSGYYLGVQLRF